MSNQVTLSINNQSITVPAGSTIMEAAQKLGVSVPHFCWHPGLSIAGVCRFCMVKVEGMPKLQIACNTPATEGMKVDTVSSDVKDAHKWALEFHLINHPLDCPICDQAGECELQNYYMKVGKYQSQMEDEKVLKPKALDVGDTLVLDTERCILCSRCVRFEDEVTKTSTLGIFNRGDQATIGTYQDRKIKHNYSYNLADICPVGAFTAKDFRFKCRVWFLKETKTVCPGCSTGCNVNLFQNSNQREYYRLKPRHNADVNGHWMCDTGRTMYEHLNASARLPAPLLNGETVSSQAALQAVTDTLKSVSADKVAVVLTAQFTNEDYKATLSTLKTLLKGTPKVFVWRDESEKAEDFDGILFRGDRNPNTRGMMDVFKEQGVSPVMLKGDFSALASAAAELTLIFGPEVEAGYPNLGKALSRFVEVKKAVYFGNTLNESAKKMWLRMPVKVFAEKSGTFVNFNGVAQKLKANPPVFTAVKGVDEYFADLSKMSQATL
ncbi:MAG: 2Fe-2S iron-sulfur cluster binding domain-containing protein [Betaproteobacteria bacterium]|nr:2Fe-2S iron-sulfur cluster binding domain-containing protein [Betaproteobacteria bacterium]